MAAQITVLDMTRRATIKVTPGTYMTEVRDEACQKFGKKHTNFDLKSNAKAIDLSRTWRQCGLTPGAKLELVESSRSPSVVSVALQPPPSLNGGARLMDKVRSDTTLWLLLRRFEKMHGLNITQRGVATTEAGGSGSGRIYHEMPRLNITGRDFSTFGELQKTLSQLGFNSGSVLVKLDFKSTDQPLEEAMSVIGEFFKEQEASSATVTTATAASTASTIVNAVPDTPSSSIESKVDEGKSSAQETQPSAQDPVKEVASPVTPAKRSAPHSDDDVVLGPNQRQISVFHAPSSDTPQAAQQPYMEADYVPSMQHLKLHEARMACNTQNKRLLSDAEEKRLEEGKAAQLENIKEVKIKIRFPDQMTIITTYTADDSAADLYASVRGMIIAENQPFKLVYTFRGPPQTIPNDASKKLIKHLGFEGNMLVNFHWEDGASADARKPSILKSHLTEMAKEPVAAGVPQAEIEEEEAGPSVGKGKGKDSTCEKVKGAMPRWFKGLHKK